MQRLVVVVLEIQDHLETHAMNKYKCSQKLNVLLTFRICVFVMSTNLCTHFLLLS